MVDSKKSLIFEVSNKNIIMKTIFKIITILGLLTLSILVLTLLFPKTFLFQDVENHIKTLNPLTIMFMYFFGAMCSISFIFYSKKV